ncbi:MAG TPA: hypothetical protein VKE94_18760, partial [Gemmataceae bacterium]|nr:hypothetical protein [Gemmataceae bacterium]
DSGKTIADLKEQIENSQKENAKILQSKNKEIKDLQTRLIRLEDKKPTYASAASDQPKGKIVLMDKTGTLPYVNLGSADRVRPQLSFSIHGVGADGRPLKDTKGSLEIINVVGEHLSQARVTEQVDPTRDPVATGDLLLNPAWDPNQQRHVAIAGIVDLSGNARKDRPADARRAVEAFIRTLENQNMVVDAWVDFTENTIKGKGITRATDYLILGIVPEGRAGAVREEDAGARQREDIQKLIAKMGDDATKLGVPIIKLRDFMAMTGQRPPRSTQEDNQPKIHSALPAVGSPVEKSVAAPRATDEPKDKNGKDKNGKDKE